MSDEERGIDLVERWRKGDQAAATMLYGRYVERMIRVIGGELSTKNLQARVDAEDVAQSAWNSVFLGLQAGRFVFRDDSDLWKLIVTVALNKARSHTERNYAARRNVQREVVTGDQPVDENLVKKLQMQPSISDVLAFRETITLAFRKLMPVDAQLLQLTLEGYSQLEIAEELEITTRTVRRKWVSIRESLSELMD